MKKIIMASLFAAVLFVFAFPVLSGFNSTPNMLTSVDQVSPLGIDILADKTSGFTDAELDNIHSVLFEPASNYKDCIQFGITPKADTQFNASSSIPAPGEPGFVVTAVKPAWEDDIDRPELTPSG